MKTINVNQTQSRPVVPHLNDRLRERLESLRLAAAAVSVCPDGATVQPIGAVGWIESLIFDSPQFEAAIRRSHGRLLGAGGEAVELWPGVCVCALGAAPRRTPSAAPFTVVMMLTDALIDSEQMHQVCQAHEVDYQVALSRVDRGLLVTPAEARRLASTLAWISADTEELARRQSELHGLSRELSESYEELSLLYKLAGNMTVNQPPAQFLSDACRELQQVVGLRWLALLVIEGDARLSKLEGRLFVAGAVADHEDARRIGKHLLRMPNKPGEATIIEDVHSLPVPIDPGAADDLMAVPLFDDHQLLGMLFGGDKLDGTRISSVDTKLCNALANSMSIFLQNMMLYDDMQAMFMGTLRALTAAIDAKDSYTHGHSERVAIMSRELARAAGLGADTAQRVYLAGLVHDVGKIGVPESVLCKAGRLTNEEFELIKKHPEIGARILADIRQMQDLIPGVLFHHERWDGRGYPQGRAGEDIPLFGRVICLADSFDAMCSSRTYRRAMGHQQAAAEIERCAGTQFDPDLARVFLGLNLQPFFDMIERHQQMDVRRSA